MSVCAHDFEVDGIYYNITSSTEKTVAVTCKGDSYDQYSGEYSDVIIIPELVLYNGESYSVTSIGYATFAYCSGLTSVDIPNSVTSIGDYVFFGCSSLTAVNIPNSVTSIGDYAFYGCSSLTAVDIPNSVSSIGKCTFLGCSSLTAVNIPNSVTSIGDYAFQDCSSLTTVEIPSGVTILGVGVFWSCSGLTSVVIPNSVTSIGEYAFIGCENLTSITIPNDVTILPEGVFAGCSNLKYVQLPQSLLTIGEYAFQLCENLRSIDIPDSVTSIGKAAFVECSVLKSVKMPKSLIIIGEYAFSGCYNLTDITIPEEVTSIGAGAFAHSKISQLFIPRTLVSIGVGAFENCDNLQSIAVDSNNPVYDSRESCNAIIETKSNTLITGCKNTNIPNTVVTLGESCFSGCSGLTDLVIPNSVIKIGGNAFSGAGISYIVFANSLKNIDEYAFYGCRNLNSVVLPNSVETLGSEVFGHCENLNVIVIPKSVKSIGGNIVSGCANLRNIVVDSDNPVYDSRESCNAIIETKSNTLIAGCQNTVIPNNVVNIGEESFWGCTNLNTIKIPNSVTNIEYRAFWYCTGLESIELSNSLKHIKSGTFGMCYSLKKIELPDSLLTIGNSAFYWCTALEEIVFPNSLTEIGMDAFNFCKSLTNIEFPKSVTAIGSGAFMDCKGLTTVYSNIAAKKLFELYNYTFDGTSITTLYVPFGAKSAYENTVGWGDFKEIFEMDPEELEIVDGMYSEFIADKNYKCGKLTYSRTLPNTEWNALYLPFKVPVEMLADDYDVAYFNNMHAYDRDNNGDIDEMDMEVMLLTEGTLHANHPYFIRAKSEDAKELNIELTDATLYATQENSLTCSSVYLNFELKGIYSQRTDNQLTGCYAINTSGAWSPIASNSYLNPFRLYLQITNRDGSPVEVEASAMQTIRIRLRGENTTDIEGVETEAEETTVIYDLSGRRVENPGKGIYIVNGKKVIFK